MKKIIFLSCLILLTACAPKEQLLRSDTTAKPEGIARLYINPSVHPSQNNYGSNITRIKDDKGEETVKSGLEIVQIPEGQYTLGLTWWKITAYEKKVYETDRQVIYEHGIKESYFSPTLYEIDFTAKKGMSYVVDVPDTMDTKTNAPVELCLLEAVHSALKVVSNKVVFPIDDSEVVSCGALTDKPLFTPKQPIAG